VWLAVGLLGTLTERMDDDKAQWVFESGVFKTYVSADEVE